MAEKEFPIPAENVVATLVDIYRRQNQPNIVELLENANPRIEQIEYDNWNGGTYSYALRLEVPASIFAIAEAKLEMIEGSISSKLANICRTLSNDHLNSVTVTPLMSKSMNIGPRAKPADADVGHIWREGFFRLFLSHVTEHNVAVSNLKSELQGYGISAFVAHEDIKPSLEWQKEIELALRSMHALAALLTPDFHSSKWTDQEVGFALGRGVHVVSVRFGLDPYGFIGKVQGLTGSLDQPSQVAGRLLDNLLKHPLTHVEARKGLVSAFKVAGSYGDAIALSKIIATVKDFAEDEKAAILNACKTNKQVFFPQGVVSRVCSAIGVPVPNKVSKEEDIPF